MTDEELV